MSLIFYIFLCAMLVDSSIQKLCPKHKNILPLVRGNCFQNHSAQQTQNWTFSKDNPISVILALV